MRKHILAATALPLAALLHPTAAPNAHACCEGQQPPTPAQLKFIADVHRVGLPGVDATQYIDAEGDPVELSSGRVWLLRRSAWRSCWIRLAVRRRGRPPQGS